MKTGTIITENVCTLIAPDGNWQPMGTGEDMAQVIGVLELMANNGIGMPYAFLVERGFKIVKAKVTIEITGTEEDAFSDMKQTEDNH